MSIFDLNAHRQIAAWKQEARAEDTNKYFFPVPEAQSLRDGTKYFLIDRKGKGKTAVGQSILRQHGPKDRATALSFKSYPVHDLYTELYDSASSTPIQYSAGWRFVMLCEVARLVVDDPKVDRNKRDAIKRLLGEGDIKEALSSRISRWISGKVRVDVAGVVGVEFETARQFMDSQKRLRDRASILHRFLTPELERTDIRYYLVFDELDEAYPRSGEQAELERYKDLLVSLFAAVCDVRDEGPYRLDNVYPVVLLRDDIFGQLEYGDRTKWTDYAVNIEWSEDTIKRLLAHRLSKAADCGPMTFSEIWPELVGSSATFKGKDKFDFIESYTLGRPRDFIYYLAEASRRICKDIDSGKSKQMKLFGDILAGCTQDFAKHLRMELEDEIVGQLRYIHGVMDVLLGISNRYFKADDFRNAYDAAAEQRNWDQSASTVLELLYSFSVIGIARKQREYFRYLYPDTEFDDRYSVLIHKGLLAARRAV